MQYVYQIQGMRFSYSRLTAYEQCHYEWLLKYIYHECGEDGFFAEYGSFVHEIIAKYLNGELDKDELPLYYARYYFDRVTSKPMSESLGLRYFRSGFGYFQGFDFPHKKIVAVEDEIEFNIGNVPFVGYVDVISEEDGELVITDHKSHDLKPFSKKYPEKKTKTDIELESYLRQLILYAVGVKKKYGRYPKTLEFNCFKSGVWISVPFDESLVEPTLKWVSDTLERITNESDWKPNMDYFFCKNLCDCRDSCEYVKED